MNNDIYLIKIRKHSNLKKYIFFPAKIEIKQQSNKMYISTPDK